MVRQTSTCPASTRTARKHHGQRGQMDNGAPSRWAAQAKALTARPTSPGRWLKSAPPRQRHLTDAAAASTLPATTSTALTALLQTVRDCLKWLLANTLQLTGNPDSRRCQTFSDRSVHAGAYTPAAQPTHSATPTFDCAVSNVLSLQQ